MNTFCGPMDVAFIIDDTGSMASSLASLQEELPAILGNIETASGGDYRLALVTFKDDVTVQDNFAPSNRASVEQKILALIAEGGSYDPEASDEALNTVVNTLTATGRSQNGDFTPDFRDGVLKLVVLVTDNPPAGFDDTYTPGEDDMNAHARALEAKAKGIKIMAISIGGDADTQVIMQDYATTTGGIYYESTGDDVGKAIRDRIASCGSPNGDPKKQEGKEQGAKGELQWEIYAPDPKESEVIARFWFIPGEGCKCKTIAFIQAVTQLTYGDKPDTPGPDEHRDYYLLFSVTEKNRIV